MKTLLIAAAALALFAAPASAQQVLKREPPMGSVKQGQVLLIDDGSCPRGQIKRIIGGNIQKNIRRTVTCVPKR